MQAMEGHKSGRKWVEGDKNLSEHGSAFEMKLLPNMSSFFREGDQRDTAWWRSQKYYTAFMNFWPGHLRPKGITRNVINAIV